MRKSVLEKYTLPNNLLEMTPQQLANYKDGLAQIMIEQALKTKKWHFFIKFLKFIGRSFGVFFLLMGVLQIQYGIVGYAVFSFSTGATLFYATRSK